MSAIAKALIVVGLALLVLGFGGGLGMSVLGTLRSFEVVAEAPMGRPDELASGIHTSLAAAAYGLPVGLVGLVLLVIGLALGLRVPTAPPRV
jgi:hypothetical protein